MNHTHPYTFSAYIARPLSTQEWYDLLQAARDAGKLTVFVEEETYLFEELPSFVACVYVPRVTDTNELFADCEQAVRDLAFTKCANGQELIDQYAIGQHSNLYFSIRHKLYFLLRSTALYAERLKHTLFTAVDAGVTAKAKCWVYHHDAAIEQFLALPENLEIRYHFAPNTATPVVDKDRWLFLKFAFLFAFRVLMGFIQLPKFLFKKWRHAIFTNPEFINPIVDLKEPKANRMDNHYIGYLLRKASLKDDFLFIDEFIPPRLTGARPLKIQRKYLLPAYPKQTINFELFTFLSLFNPMAWWHMYRMRKHLNDLNIITKEKGALATAAHLLGRTNSVVLQGVFRDHAARLFCRMCPLETLSGTNEHGVHIKPIMDVAKPRGVRTIGLQHAMFSIFYYLFDKRYQAYPALPDTTALWGEFSRELLLKGEVYNRDNTKVLGQIRTDVIPQLKDFKKSDLDERLENDRPLFLYASQPLFGDEAILRPRIARDFFKLCKALPDCQFLIKPHPLENDWSFFHDIAKEEGVSNYLILKTELYRTLAVSDIVLTFTSTVGVEAVYFKKQLIVADPYGNDPMRYMADGVGFGYVSFEQLLALTKGILEGEKQIEASAQDAFIIDRAHQIDGRTAERYLQFIISGS